MSTQIKKNGNWVTVAGGTRMWVGTKAALQAALDAGELIDGTAVMVTDDYDEGGVMKHKTVQCEAATESYGAVICTWDEPFTDTDYMVSFTVKDNLIGVKEAVLFDKKAASVGFMWYNSGTTSLTLEVTISAFKVD